MRIIEIENNYKYDKTIGILTKFVNFVKNYLDLQSLPKLVYYTTPSHSFEYKSFGGYGQNVIHLTIGNRHVLDCCRTLAHELVHYKQDVEGRLEDDSGKTGSNIENEANAVAAIIMRDWGAQYPELFRSTLNEALKLSQARTFVKGWDKTRWADIFDNKYRIYIPITITKSPNTQPDPEVEAEVNSYGYKIINYVDGIASKMGKQVKIGKLLKDPNNIKKFANDPVRQAARHLNKEMLVVISRHPYDIAGMSTNRGWTSCMNLDTEHNGNNHSHYIPVEIKEGTIIAYLVDANDKNINRPYARVLIKPFVNIANKNEIALGVEDKVYGTASSDFTDVVKQWVDNVNDSRKLDGVFELSDDVYHDTKFRVKRIGYLGDLSKEIDRSPVYFMKHNPNVSDKIKIYTLRQDAEAFEYIKNPSKEVQLVAVEEDPVLIRLIKNPDEEVQLMAVTNNAYSIKYIEHPTEAVQWYIVKNHPKLAGFIKNPIPEIKQILQQLQK